ncbi:general odorant-binding protein 67 [Bemisia tabaci]|uniref:general odorant-binding protein 67 n=1 Tax=Bemisia tabaci TaxID=7038 RepID=UPI003B289E35
MAMRALIGLFLVAAFFVQRCKAESTTPVPMPEEEDELPARFRSRVVRSASEEKSKEDSSEECGPPQHHHPHPHKPPPECCKGLPRPCNPTEDKKAWDTCVNKLSKKNPTTPQPTTQANGGKPGHGPMHGIDKQCMVECVYNETGLLTPDMKLQEAKISQKLTDKLKDTKFASMAPSVISKCFESAKNAKDPKECKSGAGEFSKCVNRELFMNCPTESWTNSEECQKMKEKLTKCPNMPVPMSPPPKP